MNKELEQINKETAGATEEVPFPCSVGHVRARDTAWGKGLEAPILVGESNPGNCFTIISLGGKGAICSSREAVTACAEQLVYRVNNFPTLLRIANQQAVEVERLKAELLKAQWFRPIDIDPDAAYTGQQLLARYDEWIEGDNYKWAAALAPTEAEQGGETL